MLNILDLPNEVIELILSFLSVYDRKQAKLANRRFFEVSRSPVLTKNEVIRIEKQSDLDRLTTPKSHINLRIVEIGPPVEKFWKDQGCFVKSLNLRGIDLQYKLLYEIINCCPSLEYLTLNDLIKVTTHDKVTPQDANLVKSAGEKLHGLVGLSLTLSFDCPSTELGFSRLTQNVQKLKYFNFYGLSAVIYGESFIQALKCFLGRQSKTLTKLTFFKCAFVNDKFLTDVYNQLGPQLTALHIRECTTSTVSNSLLPVLSSRFKKIRTIEFNCRTIFNEEYSHLFLNLKALKFLSLQSTRISDKGLAIVAGLEQLEGLDLSFCSSLTPVGIAKAFGQKELKRLLDLRLNSLNSVRQIVLENIFTQLPCLRVLFLNDCQYMGKKGIAAIMANCKSLKCLSLQSCIPLRDLIKAGINNLTNLTHLDLTYSNNVSRKFVYELKLKKLEYVFIEHAPLSEKGLKTLLENCPALKEVEISRILLGKITKNIADYPVVSCGYHGLAPNPVWDGCPY